MALSEISSILASVKTAIDLAGQLKASRKIPREVNENIAKIFDILRSVELDAASVNLKYNEVICEKIELEKKLIEREQWVATERDYELQSIGPGVFVYAYKKTIEAAEPPHWLCPRCYEEERKSILQAKYDNESAASYMCPICKTELKWHKPGAPPSVDFGSDPDRGDRW